MKTTSIVLGIVFLLIGILGFIPNGLVGDGGLFMTDMGHNLIHLVTGILFLVFAYKSSEAMMTFFKVFGIIYLVIAAWGFAIGDGSILGIAWVNGADNWLHLVLGIVILAFGYKGSGSNMQM